MKILLITLLVLTSNYSFSQQDSLYIVVWKNAIIMLEQGDTSSSILEIERFKYLNNNHKSDIVFYKLGEYYKKSSDWEKALLFYRKSVDYSTDSILYREGRYNTLYMHILLNQHYFSGKYLDNILIDSKMDINSIKECETIFIFSLLQQYRWNEALELSKALIPEKEDYCDSLFAANLNFKLKSEFKAFNHSYLPGVGQMYSGNYVEGIKSIFLQSIFLTSGIFAFNETLYILSVGFCGSGFLRLYFGGQAYALKIARTENEKKQNEAYNQIVNGLIKILELNEN